MSILIYYLVVILLAAIIGATLRFFRSDQRVRIPHAREFEEVESRKKQCQTELSQLQAENEQLCGFRTEENDEPEIPDIEVELERQVREQARLLGFTDESDIQREIAHRLQYASESMPMGKTA